MVHLPIPLMFMEAMIRRGRRLHDPSEAAVAAKRIAVQHGEKLPDECAGMIPGFLTSAWEWGNREWDD